MSRAYVRRSYLRPKYPWLAGCTNLRHGSVECKTWDEAMLAATEHARTRKHEIRGARKSTPTPIYEGMRPALYPWESEGLYPRGVEGHKEG
jgi:hypothetical protein